MPLTSGTKLGPYEIQSLLGAGGMGEVYRGLDTRLNRTVAIKVLASHLSLSKASDSSSQTSSSQASFSPELRQRMEREARAISSLNHPHICQLYDIGAQDGIDYLVMEFLEGETLAEKLRGGPLPLTEVLKIGTAVAEALAVAHLQGIVHRDLKPGNIMLTPRGAKLMDFGLAKPLSAPAGAGPGHPPSFTAAPTLSGPNPLSPLTAVGSIVGTMQYMSPEQIEGREADARSDIFAFGALLYEMATGKRPFEGKSQISLASAILDKDPVPLSELKPGAPPAFEHIVSSCLEKNSESRFQNARDIQLELQWIASGRSVPVPLPATDGTSSASTKLPWKRVASAVALMALIALGLGVAIGSLIHRSPLPSAQTIRTVINPPLNTALNLTGDFAGPPVLAPDGSAIAFTATGADGKTALWIRPMNLLEAHEISGTEGAIFPFWSPDSRSLGFFAGGKLKIIDLNGGAAQVLADAAFGRGGAWGANGVILYAPISQTFLMRISASGGRPVPATKLDSTLHTSHRWPFFLPDGKHFLYSAIQHEPSKAANDAIFYASVDGRENRPILSSQSNAVYANGFLLFGRGEQLMAQRFDPDSGKLSGEAQSVAKGVMNDLSTWHLDASASNDGVLVFCTGGTGDWQLVWVDRGGRQTGVVADKLTNLQSARISPQGDRIAYQINTAENDIWVLDLGRGVSTRLTFGPIANTYPVWSPDGKWIAYSSDRHTNSGIYRKHSDGSGSDELLVTDEQQTIADDWSRDGKYLLYSRGPVVSDRELWVLPLEGERKPRLIQPHASNSLGSHPRLSPDGRWLAYVSTDSGTSEVYVEAFGSEGGKWQVSANGGSQPQWSNDGRELYFVDSTFTLFAVPVKEVKGALQFDPPQTLVANWSAPQVFFDVAPNGKKILMDKVSQQVSGSVTVVTNFAAGLEMK